MCSCNKKRGCNRQAAFSCPNWRSILRLCASWFVIQLPSETAISKQTEKTKNAFEEMINGNLAAAQPTRIAKQGLEPTFVRCGVPNQKIFHFIDCSPTMKILFLCVCFRSIETTSSWRLTQVSSCTHSPGTHRHSRAKCSIQVQSSALFAWWTCRMILWYVAPRLSNESSHSA